MEGEEKKTILINQKIVDDAHILAMKSKLGIYKLLEEIDRASKVVEYAFTNFEAGDRDKTENSMQFFRRKIYDISRRLPVTSHCGEWRSLLAKVESIINKDYGE